jgi:hypothetical protein
MDTEPWKGERDVKEGPYYPASYVGWEDAVAYCKKLSGRKVRRTACPQKLSGSTPAGQGQKHGGALAIVMWHLVITLGTMITLGILMRSTPTKLH